jgi:hypothetical protein
VSYYRCNYFKLHFIGWDEELLRKAALAQFPQLRGRRCSIFLKKTTTVGDELPGEAARFRTSSSRQDLKKQRVFHDPPFGRYLMKFCAVAHRASTQNAADDRPTFFVDDSRGDDRLWRRSRGVAAGERFIRRYPGSAAQKCFCAVVHGTMDGHLRDPVPASTYHAGYPPSDAPYQEKRPVIAGAVPVRGVYSDNLIEVVVHVA